MLNGYSHVIRLSRGAEPEVLAENRERWRSEYLQRIGGDTSVPRAALRRYAHEHIKAAVMRDSHGKCMYCESKPRAVYPGAVEHILPKAPDRFPDKVVDWDNLGFVCFECNRCKGDYWDEETPILDPYVDEPDHHLLFIGPLVLPQAASPRGIVTVHELELDSRIDLIERKIEHLRTVKSYLRSWHVEADGPLKRVLEEQIRRYASDDAEYAAATRVLLVLDSFPL